MPRRLPTVLAALTLGVWPAAGAEGVVAGAQERTAACPRPPVEPCAKRHGRLSSQNGIAYRIWIVGTTRVVGIVGGLDTLPAVVGRYLSMTSEDHSDIFGDYTLCPIEPDRPGHLRWVCVTGGEKLVVQPVRRPGPAFRLLSTWPPAGGGR